MGSRRRQWLDRPHTFLGGAHARCSVQASRLSCPRRRGLSSTAGRIEFTARAQQDPSAAPGPSSPPPRWAPPEQRRGRTSGLPVRARRDNASGGPDTRLSRCPAGASGLPRTRSRCPAAAVLRAGGERNKGSGASGASWQSVAAASQEPRGSTSAAEGLSCPNSVRIRSRGSSRRSVSSRSRSTLRRAPSVCVPCYRMYRGSVPPT